MGLRAPRPNQEGRRRNQGLVRTLQRSDAYERLQQRRQRTNTIIGIPIKKITWAPNKVHQRAHQGEGFALAYQESTQSRDRIQKEENKKTSPPPSPHPPSFIPSPLSPPPPRRLATNRWNPASYNVDEKVNECQAHHKSMNIKAPSQRNMPQCRTQNPIKSLHKIGGHKKRLSIVVRIVGITTQQEDIKTSKIDKNCKNNGINNLSFLTTDTTILSPDRH